MGRLIAISPGHYPEKPGACHDGFCEYDEAVRWADLLCDLLGPGNAVRVPGKHLKDKVAFINARTPGIAVAVDIHFNAAADAEGNPVGRGCETLYMPDSDDSKCLAEACHAALVSVFTPDRGVKEGWYRMQKKFGPDFFLAKTPCPAIIIEPDFIHRRELITAGREEACRLLAKVLLDYVTEDA